VADDTCDKSRTGCLWGRQNRAFPPSRRFHPSAILLERVHAAFSRWRRRRRRVIIQRHHYRRAVINLYYPSHRVILIIPCVSAPARARAPASLRDYERSRSSCWRSLFDERDEIGSVLLKVSSRRSVRRRNQPKHVRVCRELGEMNGRTCFLDFSIPINEDATEAFNGLDISRYERSLAIICIRRVQGIFNLRKRLRSLQLSA